MTADARESRPLATLAILAAGSWLAYLGVALGGQSLHEEGPAGHSLLAILGQFAVAFGCYLAALRVAVRARQDRRLVALIVGAAAAFRVTLLGSDPIEEIDLYRYLWDGQATLAGVSPFRYSPAQVLAASRAEALPPGLARLAAIRDGSPELRAILGRVHFAELTTIYPPTSQLVFALASSATPRGASVPLRMAVMKAWFVAFDLATLGLVLGLLRHAGRPAGWSLAYGWCPLLIKEVANSGHLDAVAVFLTTLALSLAVRARYRPAGGRTTSAVAAGLVLGLAVGAKLYPIVLAPLVFAGSLGRFGWRRSLGPLAAFGLTTALVAWPMLPAGQGGAPAEVAPEASRGEDRPPLPPLAAFPGAGAAGQGLSAFLSEWEMNDFLFLLLMENLRPYGPLPPHERAWFSVVPERWRTDLVTGVHARLGIEPRRVPFFASRAIASACFLALALALARQARRAETAAAWLDAAFLTVAWFWLVQPTLNPWYWTWALPLLPFARGRAWLAMSGLAFLYYLRFWLADHFPGTPLLGTRYPGPWFFDYIVAWLEFGPWFAWLAIEALVARRSSAWGE